MASRNVIRFIKALDRDGATQKLIGLISEVGGSIPFYAFGKITYTLDVELQNIREYYTIDIELVFNNALRNSRVVEARKITLDEYVGNHWRDNRELRDTYFEMLKQFER